ncbi:hypothetical protein A2752_00850 [Candidatus Uhrbacteria bacterium RIFCSPHIGHO2_01_FULL_46_23]|nr:MAG: hypothetical protein A2752_00850 [Candidatus Uhrbacteria bacterium RIFCSPHIGHO2_01_FULL_46_23]
MLTKQTQIKLNIPLQLKDYLESRAARFGMPIAGYVRHLIVKDVEEMDYPTYRASEEVEKAYEKAMKEKDKSILVKGDIGDFLDSL